MAEVQIEPELNESIKGKKFRSDKIQTIMSTQNPSEPVLKSQEDNSDEMPKKKSKWWIWLLVILVVLGGAAASYFLYFKDKISLPFLS